MELIQQRFTAELQDRKSSQAFTILRNYRLHSTYDGTIFSLYPSLVYCIGKKLERLAQEEVKI